MRRCLQRHGISRLPQVEGDKPASKQKFKSYPIKYFHVDIAEVRTEEGKLRLLVAIDRTSKFVYAELHPSAGKMEAAQFLRNPPDLLDGLQLRQAPQDTQGPDPPISSSVPLGRKTLIGLISPHPPHTGTKHSAGPADSAKITNSAMIQQKP